MAQTASPPVLTIDDAIATAMKGNRRVQSSIRDVRRAGEGTADVKTQRLPHLQVYVLGGEALNSINFTIPQGALGAYPGIGPIPAQNAKISTPQTLTGLVLGQATQPLSQLWKVHLAVLESKIGEEFAQESLRQQRQDTAHSVRDLYYQIAQTQTQVASAEANVEYLVDLQAETDRNLAEQTALKGDSLTVKAKFEPAALPATDHTGVAGDPEGIAKSVAWPRAERGLLGRSATRGYRRRSRHRGRAAGSCEPARGDPGSTPPKEESGGRSTARTRRVHPRHQRGPYLFVAAQRKLSAAECLASRISPAVAAV
jgi:hypothetical protein